MEVTTIWMLSAILCNVVFCINAIISPRPLAQTVKEAGKILLCLNAVFFMFGPFALAIMVIIFVITLLEG